MEAAERRAAAVGMSKLRVGQVAAEAGVSRQTVYNEFGDKFGLAQAVAVQIANRLLDVIEIELAKYPTLAEAVAAATSVALRLATEQPLIRLALTRKEDDDLIVLLTTDAAPVFEIARERLIVAGAHLWPEAYPEDIELASDMATRLVISHIVCPTESIDQAARKLAYVVDALVRARHRAVSRTVRV